MKLVLLSSSPCVDGGLAKSVADQHGVELSSVQIVSNSACLTQTQLPQTYDVAISISDSSDFHTPEYLSAVSKILVPGATLQIQQPSPTGAQTTDKMKHALVLSGFVDVQPVGSVPGLLILRASLPKWGIGTKSALPLKSKQKPSAAIVSVSAQPAASAWAMNPNEDEELVDDDELLTQDDLARPAPVAKKADDCEVGAGRKACKDCTCGRAEAEAKGVKVELTQEMIDNPQSSCGNCSLGDAFRCASCPYKGLPSFEPGKKIQLPSNFLVADV